MRKGCHVEGKRTLREATRLRSQARKAEDRAIQSFMPRKYDRQIVRLNTAQGSLSMILRQALRDRCGVKEVYREDLAELKKEIRQTKKALSTLQKSYAGLTRNRRAY